jgi:hypothetical protein
MVLAGVWHQARLRWLRVYSLSFVLILVLHIIWIISLLIWKLLLQKWLIHFPALHRKSGTEFYNSSFNLFIEFLAYLGHCNLNFVLNREWQILLSSIIVPKANSTKLKFCLIKQYWVTENTYIISLFIYENKHAQLSFCY